MNKAASGIIRARYHEWATATSSLANVTVDSNPVDSNPEATIGPSSGNMDLGQSRRFSSSVLNGASPYTYQWYLDGSPYLSLNVPAWTFTPNSIGTYQVYLIVTDHMNKSAASNTASVTVNPVLSVTLEPTLVSAHVGKSLLFISTALGGTLPYYSQWYINGSPVPGAVGHELTFKLATNGIYRVNLRVADSAGSIVCSDTASINVTAVSVGGYSLPLEESITANPFALYFALIAAFATGLAAIRRKASKTKFMKHQ